MGGWGRAERQVGRRQTSGGGGPQRPRLDVFETVTEQIIARLERGRTLAIPIHRLRRPALKFCGTPIGDQCFLLELMNSSHRSS